MADPSKQSRAKTTLLWVVLIGLFVALFALMKEDELPFVDFQTFRESVEEGAVVSVRINGNEITVSNWDGFEYRALGVVDDELTQTLSESGVVIEWGEPDDPIRSLLLVGVPLLVLVALFAYFLKKGMAGATGSVLDLKKSRARLMTGVAVKFGDVGGCEEAKDSLGDVIDFLKHPDRWKAAGVRMPRGVLLEGPPGCGKTLLARAVAGETDAKFYSVSASEFVEMFVGVGAARVRDMFDEAAKNAPAVVFIDELDAVGRRRGSGIGAAHDEREQTLNQILVCMDGFENGAHVVVIAATNRSDVLDDALLRPGRFDRRITVPALGRDQRLEVLQIHAGNKKLGDGVSLDEVADRTEGWTGAQLESLVNEAGLLAVRRVRIGEGGEVAITADDFAEAMKPQSAEQERFNAVDALLVESTSQLARAKGRALVRIERAEGDPLEGELVWADAMFLKLRLRDGSQQVVAKALVKGMGVLGGTDDAIDVSPDRFVGVQNDLA